MTLMFLKVARALKCVLTVAGLAAVTFGSATAAEMAPVKLGILKLGAMTNVWVAGKEGIFKKNGLDVTIVEIPMASQLVAALQSKTIDIVLQIPGTAMVAKERGFDLILVGQNETAGTAPPVSNALMVTKDSPIKSIKDLKGKKAATSSPRGQTFAALKELFQREGLADQDVLLIETPHIAHADVLRSKQVDAVVTLDPYTTQIIKAGYGRTLSWYLLDTIPDQPVGSWWSLRSWATSHAKEVLAFQASIKESHDYLNSDQPRAKKLVAEFSGLNPQLVEEMPLISWKSTVDPSVWQKVADMMQRQGELTNKHDVSEYLK